MSTTQSSLFRLLPSVTEVDLYLKEQQLPFGKPVRAPVQKALQQLREQIANPDPQTAPLPYTSKEHILRYLAQVVQHRGELSTCRVINATGVVIHTNLGRAPLSRQLIDLLLPLLSSYSTIEYNLSTGKRGTRGERVKSHLCLLSGAEEALVVNNNAAAVYLMLMALAPGKEVIVSRGELIEIGGAFRIPDIMRAAGVTLVEVGTTNRTRIADYEKTISEKTAALMKVHPSNYAIRGFVEEASIGEIAQLAKSRQLYSFYDLGSGNFYRFAHPALQGLPTVQQELRSGVDLVTFSGDKLLGSTQSGIVVGRQALIQLLSKHPLYRALRLDKITLALLEVHLAAYFNMETLPQMIPTIGMIEQTQEEIQAKAEVVYKTLKIPKKSGWQGHLEQAASLTGGGALPEVSLDSTSLVIHHKSKTAEHIQEFLRHQTVPIIGRVQNNQVWFDFRTIFPEDFPLITKTLHQLFATL